MKIDCLVLGAYETNSYLLRVDETATNCLIIDTGLAAGKLVSYIGEHKLNPAAVVLTHGHADHITGVAALRQNFPDIKVYIHKLDAQMLTGQEENLSALAGTFFTAAPADFLVDQGSIIDEAGIKLLVLHTPGHTPGGICLYSEKDQIVFVGDTLFADSVGRTDLPGGSMAQLIKCITDKLLILPDQTVCYPGHGPSTTIAYEREHNQYLQ